MLWDIQKVFDRIKKIRSIPKILFWPSLGKNFGVGNLIRCLTLASEMRDRACAVFILPDDFTCDDLLPRHFVYVSENIWKDIISIFDLLVFDHQGPIRATVILKQIKLVTPDILIIALDYFYYQDMIYLDAVINLSDYNASSWYKKHGRCRYYHGLRYAIIRPQFFRLRKAKKYVIKEKVKKVLITFGGGDKRNWTLRAMKWLEKCVFEKINVWVVIGALNHRKKDLEQFAKGRPHRYQILKHMVDIEKYMSQADVIFCGCGTTLMESAFLGKQVIALPQHNAEKNFLKEFIQSGYVLGDFEDDLHHLESQPLDKIFHGKEYERQEISQRGMRLVDGKGVRRITDIFIQFLKRQ